jgi:hypothetical protein
VRVTVARVAVKEMERSQLVRSTFNQLVSALESRSPLGGFKREFLIENSLSL